MTLINHDLDELLDLVDNEDQVVGKLERSKVYAAKLNNFRVINAFLVNKKGQLWIPRRTSHKRLFPLHLDVSVGGHVSSGESYEEAFERELKEELNLSLQEIKFQKLGALTPHQHQVSAFMHVYKIFFDEVPPYNRDDFMQYYWLYPEQALEKINNFDKAKGDLPLLIRAFFL
jgi:isopentenyldiphosphate isomerase